MPLQLFAHPFSSYCQKVLVALYEHAIPFEWRLLDGPDSPAMIELVQRWPLRKFPMLLDGERCVVEASCIIEYLERHHAGTPRLLPDNPDAALEVRFMDRFFDNYVSTPQQKFVFDCLRPESRRDAHGVDEARAMLETAYAWLDARLKGRTWAAGEDFSLADCGAAPFLFYADWTHAIDPRFTRVHAYRRRLLQRPSFARAVDEARPWRHYFPLGAPDRD